MTTKADYLRQFIGLPEATDDEILALAKGSYTEACVDARVALDKLSANLRESFRWSRRST